MESMPAWADVKKLFKAQARSICGKLDDEEEDEDYEDVSTISRKRLMLGEEKIDDQPVERGSAYISPAVPVPKARAAYAAVSTNDVPASPGNPFGNPFVGPAQAAGPSAAPPPPAQLGNFPPPPVRLTPKKSPAASAAASAAPGLAKEDELPPTAIAASSGAADDAEKAANATTSASEPPPPPADAAASSSAPVELEAPALPAAAADAAISVDAPPSLDDIMAEVQRLEEQGKLVEASTLMVAHLRMQGAKQNAGGAAAVE